MRQDATPYDAGAAISRSGTARRVLALAATIVVVEALGALSGWAGPDTRAGWYAGLAKPSLQPPGWVFGVVWPILYALIATAAFLVAERIRVSQAAAVGLTLFSVQLALNYLWSSVFFGYGLLDLSFWLIVTIAVLAVAATAFFAKARALSGLLMLPYLAWLGFAAYLAGFIAAAN